MASAPTSETATTTPTEAGDRTGRRGPGRPPDLEKRQAIIDATLDVLAEVGYASLTIDAVAKRAGSNRVLIYRVWDSKVLLVRDTLFGLAANLTLPDTGSTREDLRDFVRQHVDHMRLPAYVNGVPGLTVELLSNRELFRDTWQQFIKPTEDGFATLLARGRARGDVVPRRRAVGAHPRRQRHHHRAGPDRSGVRRGDHRRGHGRRPRRSGRARRGLRSVPPVQLRDTASHNC